MAGQFIIHERKFIDYTEFTPNNSNAKGGAMLHPLIQTLKKPIAITMWDFSWLERRWPGAGYEDWERALDELQERGYDAIRIDAYPHLVHADADKEWLLVPTWNQQTWGAPANIKVSPWPALAEFIEVCAKKDIKVALSSWFRADEHDIRLNISSPRSMTDLWMDVLDRLDAVGLLDSILYVDLCNEFPVPVWIPSFTHNIAPGANPFDWCSAAARSFMKASIEPLRAKYPDLPFCYSFVTGEEKMADFDASYHDLIDIHIWMAGANEREFYRRVGYEFQQFDSAGYDNLAKRGEDIYRADEAYWLKLQKDSIQYAADWSVKIDRPLCTTEGWGVVDYKDWPMLDWGWVKELTVHGVETAVDTGRWFATCTSNFCGPQFVGMWRDVDYHQRLTSRIHAGALPN
jgi:hypothetical protein